MKLNIIIPVYNEEGNLNLLYSKIKETLKEQKYQIIFINDGSTDHTSEKLEQLYKSDPDHLKVINFSRNFGKDAAIYAGLTKSNSEYTVIIDGDLQQNPKYIIDMMEFLENNHNYDQVAMINKERKEKIYLRILKNIFYTIINLLSDTNFKKNVSDFRMFRKNVVEAILTLNENNRFSKGIFSWVGFNTKYMPYKVENRYTGKSNFNTVKSFKYAWEGIVNFSIKPLKLATIIGTITSLFAFVYFLIIIIKTLIHGNNVPGYPSLICLILFLGGLNLLAIGIMGEYLSKMYLEVKKRPIYVTKNTLGFDDNIL